MDPRVEKLTSRHRWLILVAMTAQIGGQIRGQIGGQITGQTRGQMKAMMAATIIALVFGSSGVAHAAPQADGSIACRGEATSTATATSRAASARRRTPSRASPQATTTLSH